MKKQTTKPDEALRRRVDEIVSRPFTPDEQADYDRQTARLKAEINRIAKGLRSGMTVKALPGWNKPSKNL